MKLPESMNSAAAKICFNVLEKAGSYGVNQINVKGASVIEFAPDKIGTLAGGTALAEICMGGQGGVSVDDGPFEDCPMIKVAIDNPLAACIGCQYAGWPLSVGNFFAMASGPVRLLRGKEAVLAEYDLQQPDQFAVVVLESSRNPDETVVQMIADECGLPLEKIIICVARTSSISGALQVVARSVEVAMHKLHELKFDLNSVVKGEGMAPLPPKTDDDLIALGWTNDSVLYGGVVKLTVDCDDDSIAQVIQSTPSCHSAEFGRPFLDLFNYYDRDFYKIDPLLFSPAKILVHNQRTGNEFSAGEIRTDILKQSFGK